jgi:hypothetical protein
MSRKARTYRKWVSYVRRCHAIGGVARTPYFVDVRDYFKRWPR